MKLKIFMIVFLSVLFTASAEAIQVHHDMRLTLSPGKSRLNGIDTLTMRPAPPTRPILYLNRLATEVRIEANGQPVPFKFNNGTLRPQIPGDLQQDTLRLTVAYAVKFDDPVPVMPANTDNPGYGVSGTISPAGTLLLDGAGWYPHIDADRTTYRLQVEAPAGTVAVTAGRSLGHMTDGDRTVSTWEIDYPVRGLSLSAARFRVSERTMGNLTVATYLLPGSVDLAGPYLDATERYLRMYEDLFGPYPFDKFAVVENFFPTGYGFPSYTLLGSRVLRLPFIIDTSLGHEIAHCWWGNGVYVDPVDGNWSEGLTTYLADYLYKERESSDAAREYRRQILRNFATLVNPGNDFPINRFKSRNSPLTKTIGYDKSAMVFHMLRQQLGEEVFWGGLRDIYREFLFKPVSWRQLRESFERRAGIDLKDFFNQWVTRDGAPRLILDDVTAMPENGKWYTRGKLVQEPPFFNADVEVLLAFATEEVRQKVSITSSAGVASFVVESPEPPRALMVDPDVHLFRKLDPSEIPVSINTLKAADAVLVVLAHGMETDSRPSANIMGRSLGLDNFQVVSESQVTSAALRSNDLLLIGYGATADKLLSLAAREREIQFSAKKFTFRGQVFDQSTDSFFGVFDHPLARGRSVALYLPLSSQHVEAVARKITHYGKYSYLSFSGVRNRTKGVWAIEKSPLIHRFSYDG